MLLPINCATQIPTPITSPSFFSISSQNPTRYKYLRNFPSFETPNLKKRYLSIYVLYYLMQEMIQEQITRVLLERLIVNRPHPWGLLITFIELIKVIWDYISWIHGIWFGLLFSKMLWMYNRILGTTSGVGRLLDVHLRSRSCLNQFPDPVVGPNLLMIASFQAGYQTIFTSSLLQFRFVSIRFCFSLILSAFGVSALCLRL